MNISVISIFSIFFNLIFYVNLTNANQIQNEQYSPISNEKIEMLNSRPTLLNSIKFKQHQQQQQYNKMLSNSVQQPQQQHSQFYHNYQQVMQPVMQPMQQVMQSPIMHSQVMQPQAMQPIMQPVMQSMPMIQPQLVMQPVGQMMQSPLMLQPQYHQQHAPLMQSSNPFIAQNMYQEHQNSLGGNYGGQQLKYAARNKKRQFKLPRSKSCGISKPRVTKYVANGEPTEDHEWPWHVQLTIGTDVKNNDIETYCGGSIISPNFILTAAHCYDEIAKEVMAEYTHIHIKGLNLESHKHHHHHHHHHKGKKPKNDKLIVQAKAVVIHHDYSPGMTEEMAARLGKKAGPLNDIAIVYFKLDDPSLEKKLIPICLPSEKYELKLNTKCRVMGHGFMNARDEDRFHMPTILQMADVAISSNEACRKVIDLDNIKNKITENTVCIRGNKHPCIGDSRGPLLCVGKSNREIFGETDDDSDDYGDEYPHSYKGHLDKHHQVEEKQWYLMGVTSFAVSANVHDKCGNFKSAVFTKVSNYMKWILEMMTQVLTQQKKN